MFVLEFLFWCSLALVFYTYVGYGLLMGFLVRFFSSRPRPEEEKNEIWPRLTFIIPAYNEAPCLEAKIANTLALQYPSDKWQIWVVTDGSTDASPEIARRFEQVKVWHQRARKGKINALNRVMKHVETEVVVFSDANTFLPEEALKKLVQPYQDPAVGAVAGEKRVKNNGQAQGSEGLYWRYESWLKQQDAAWLSVVGAAGELFSCRTALFKSAPEHIILDDFVISLEIAAQGYRVAYVPQAYAVEEASAQLREEWQRKVRISAGGLQALFHLHKLFNFRRYGWLSFQFVSHRALRWTLAPALLPALLCMNAFLCKWPLYQVLGLGQLLFYGLALVGYSLRHQPKKHGFFFIPFYFLMMNAAVWAGWWRFGRKEQTVLWEKASRNAYTTTATA